MKRTDLPREVAAGLTLAALVIPLNIGYAQVAGVSPVVGLYAGILPLAVFALLTSSRHVVSSPNASMAALIVYRFGAPLYFANANLLVEQVEQLVTQPSHPVERFVLDAQAIAAFS